MEPDEARAVKGISDDLYDVKFYFEGWRLMTIDIEIKDQSAIPPADLTNRMAIVQWVHAVWGGIAQAMARVPPKTMPLPDTRDGKPCCPSCGVVLDAQRQTCPSAEPTYRCGKCGMNYKSKGAQPSWPPGDATPTRR